MNYIETSISLRPHSSTVSMKITNPFFFCFAANTSHKSSCRRHIFFPLWKHTRLVQKYVQGAYIHGNALYTVCKHTHTHYTRQSRKRIRRSCATAAGRESTVYKNWNSVRRKDALALNVNDVFFAVGFAFKWFGQRGDSFPAVVVSL